MRSDYLNEEDAPHRQTLTEPGQRRMERNRLSTLAYVLLVPLPLINLSLWFALETFPDEWNAFLLLVLMPNMLAFGVLLFFSRNWFCRLLAAMVPLEVMAGTMAFHTIGEIDSGLKLALVWLNLISVAFYLSKKKVWAIGTAGLLCLMLTSPQIWLGIRFLQLKSEARSIMYYAAQFNEREGEYPTDLSGYDFSSPSLQKHFTYVSDGKNRGYRIFYYVGTPQTSHWYDSENGWAYYPD